MRDLLDCTLPEITEYIQALGQPKYRAEQVFFHLHGNGNGGVIPKISEMQNLPKALREQLEKDFFVTEIDILKELISTDGNTRKFLTKINDAYAESVLMRYKHGDTVCISTQAGCKMGCTFCASAESGFHRNLTAGEYCAQVYLAKNHAEALQASGQSLKNIVLMGCGEPLDNFGETIKFIELITHPKGLNLSQRNITLSTCGLVPQIYALADLNLKITLAVSLHAPTDEIRAAIMPIAKKYPLDELLRACKYYEKTRRRITFEYALIKGVNDSVSHAKALAKLLRGMLCHVNLIPVNKARGGFSPAAQNEVRGFAAVLEDRNIPVTVRRSLGADIDAACGQLRGECK
ncbi:MAG: 23S rRNA (adenine(2503)-C(2))-methyltransferase RlmN [Defluviitaleaceae bacterium]|nr:23S rRNA (adenine(2503)-C(2))-methyltransferase RlmN [Defluviitaleaceae bacterium]